MLRRFTTGTVDVVVLEVIAHVPRVSISTGQETQCNDAGCSQLSFDQIEAFCCMRGGQRRVSDWTGI